MTEDHIKIESVDDARRVIARLHDHQKELVARADTADEAHKRLAENMESKVADLKEANRVLTEATNRANMSAESASGVNPFIRRGTDGDDRIVWRSGPDRNGDWQDGLLNTRSDDAWVERLQDLAEQRTLVRAMTKGVGHRAAPGASPRTDAQIRRHLLAGPPVIQRLFSDTTSTGAEFIPDVVSPNLERDLQSARRVEALFQVVPMTDKELRLPFLTTGLRPYKKGSITTDDPGQYSSSTVVTAQRSVTAVGLATRTQLDEDTTEDSIIPALPLHRVELVSALTDGSEDCIINGDSAATHQDTISGWDIRSRWGTEGLGGSGDHRTTWLGLRAYAADNSATNDGSAAETYAGFLSALALMDAPHGVAGDVAMITSYEYYLAKMLGWAEVVTLDKLGPQATILSGQLSSVGNKPVIISDFVDKEYNVSGLYDDTTKTKTGFLVVNRTRWKMGVRRAAMVEVDKDITRGVINAVSTVRKVFFTVDSTKKNVIWDYNHSVS